MSKRPTQEELQAESDRLYRLANEELPGSDAARIARLEARVFTLQVGVAGLVRTVESLSRVLERLR